MKRRKEAEYHVDPSLALAHTLREIEKARRE
jgi:hypothetical protein